MTAIGDTGDWSRGFRATVQDVLLFGCQAEWDSCRAGELDGTQASMADLAEAIKELRALPQLVELVVLPPDPLPAQRLSALWPQRLRSLTLAGGASLVDLDPATLPLASLVALRGARVGLDLPFKLFARLRRVCLDGSALAAHNLFRWSTRALVEVRFCHFRFSLQTLDCPSLRRATLDGEFGLDALFSILAAVGHAPAIESVQLSRALQIVSPASAAVGSSLAAAALLDTLRGSAVTRLAVQCGALLDWSGDRCWARLARLPLLHLELAGAKLPPTFSLARCSQLETLCLRDCYMEEEVVEQQAERQPLTAVFPATLRLLTCIGTVLDVEIGRAHV